MPIVQHNLGATHGLRKFADDGSYQRSQKERFHKQQEFDYENFRPRGICEH